MESMVLFNYATRELTAKVVYYGPGLCGKTTNLQYIHENLPGKVKGKMLSLATKTDRTLFFDFLPIDLGEIRGMKTRVQLYTVPGQVFYNETRKLVLKGADGIVFVADSQEAMMSANVESFKNLEENLRAHNMNLSEMPHVIQFNKRDLPKVAGVEDLSTSVNKFNAPFYEAVATSGIGVQDTLKAITKLVLLHLTKKYDPETTTQTPVTPQAIPEIVIPPTAMDSIPLAVSEETPAETPTAPVAAAAEAGALDDLMQEIADTPSESVGDATQWISPQGDDTPPPAPMFEIDSGLNDLAPAMKASEPTEPVTPMTPPAPSQDMQDGMQTASSAAAEAPIESMLTIGVTEESDDTEVVLKDLADDTSLFQDPDLDVTSMQAGEERELLIPVRLGSGTEVQNFKLTVRMRLDRCND
jgi:signal recognition particle receptor subunit beta